MKSNVIKGRISINGRTKRRVFAKSNMRCARCGNPLYYNSSHSTVDHIIPLSRGGQNNVGNFIGLCEHCNIRKGDRIVLPTSYFMNMAYNGKNMLEANAKTIKWACNNVTLDYIEQNPLVFDEFFYTLNLNEKGLLQAFTGYKAATNKRVSVYKLEDDEIEECAKMAVRKTELAKITLEHCVKMYPTYVFRNYNRAARVESAITIHLDGSALYVDVIFSEHNKTLGTLLDKILNDIHLILNAIEVDGMYICGLSEEAMDLLRAHHNYSKIDEFTVYKKVESEEVNK